MISKAKNIIKMPVFKALFALAIPIIMANLFQAMYQMTDSFWVGRVGGPALAAVSICSPIIFLTISIGVGFAIAGSTFVAQYFGAKNNKMVNHAAAQTILMIIISSLIFSIIGFIFAPQILTYMGANNEIFGMALSFLRVSFIGILSNFCFFIFQSIMRGIGRPQIPVFIVIGTVILNFILDPIFIFGFGPIGSYGPTGAALTTLITQTLAAAAGFIILFDGRHGIGLNLKNFKPDFSFIGKAFKVGFPSSLEQSSRNLVMVIITSLIASFGTIAVASYGAGTNIIQIIFMISIGLSIANSTLVGHSIGAKNISEAVRASKLSAIISFSLISFLAVLIFIFARSIISFFVPSDINVINGATIFIRIVSIDFSFMALRMCFGGVFNAAGLTKINMLITIFIQWLIQIPIAYFLSRHTSFGVNGIWISFPITNIIGAIIAYTIYHRGSWKKINIIHDEKTVSQVSNEIKVEEGIH